MDQYIASMESIIDFSINDYIEDAIKLVDQLSIDSLSMLCKDDLILQNYRVVILRAIEQSQELTTKLEDLGANVVLLPMISIVPNKEAIDTVNQDYFNQYDAIIFTSVNCVKILFDDLIEKNIDLKILESKNIIVIGPKTRDTCLEYGIQPHIMPETFEIISLLEILKDVELKTHNILITKSKEAPLILKDELNSLGAKFDYLSIYHNIKPSTVNVKITDGDIVLFMSPSSAERFFTSEVYKKQEIIAFCIGNTTAHTVKQFVNKHIYLPKQATSDSLIDEIIQYAKGLI